MIMKEKDEKIPDPKELEKEISEFLAKKFGENVKIVSPMVVPQEAAVDQSKKAPEKKKKINFDLKPEELIAYLDQYVVKQDNAKAILATKICTHFNRIKRLQEGSHRVSSMVGSIKNNVLMIGPTGVGKTYIIKLIANKIGVPFVKGDATKFSETGYVGGDVEDLVRDLVREADDDIELAQQVLHLFGAVMGRNPGGFTQSPVAQPAQLKTQPVPRLPHTLRYGVGDNVPVAVPVGGPALENTLSAFGKQAVPIIG